MVKKDIRKIYIEKRRELSPEQFREQSASMLQQFQQLPLPVIHTALSYYPIPGRAEFNVAHCEAALLTRYPSATIAWPRLRNDGQHVDAIPLDHRAGWKTNRYGIPQPVGGTAVSPLLIDLVLVPLLAFDKKGYRVG